MIWKVCGMCHNDNIEAVDRLGADWLGLIFYTGSRRYAGDTDLNDVALAAHRIGVFVDAGLAEINHRALQYQLHGAQLHGQEDPAFCHDCRQLGLMVIKSFAVGKNFDFCTVAAYEGSVDYLLFDTLGSTPGGTGKTFDWTVLEGYRAAIPFLLSGGIGPDCVASLLAFEHPMWAGIDINSRFEIEPGLKDVGLIERFRDELFGR